MQHLTTLLMLVLLGCYHIQAQDAAPTSIAGQYIVLLKTSAATPVTVQEIASASREQTVVLNQPKRDANLGKLASIRHEMHIAGETVIAEFADAFVGFSARLTPEEVARLNTHPDVEGVYQDYYIQLETQSDEGPPPELAPAGQTIPCAISKAGGFQKSTGSNWIWILDTGIDLDHPDLTVGSMLPFAKSFIPSETCDDGNGHGTHVAGIAAANNNDFGIVGVSAGALVIPVKVLANSGLTAMTYVLQGLNHVAMYDSAGDVVNLSLGSYPVNNCGNYNLALKTAIFNLSTNGTWVCMAAGNNAGLASMCAPGCINGARIYTVGGTTCSGDCYAATNWGNTVVDWVATGVNVYSTYKNGSYATLSGTSQATPIVAGIIHARGGAPVTGGTVHCGNLNVPPANYKIAKRQ